MNGRATHTTLPAKRLKKLVEIVADPRHPDHEDRLEWLGLADPREFDPAGFDVEKVNQALAALR